MKRVNSKTVKVFVVIMVSLVLGVSQGFTAEWSSVFKKVKAKYEKFGKEIKDMTTIQEMKMVSPQGEMNSKVKIFVKGKKFKMVSTMEVPGMPKGMETTIICDGKSTWMISPFMGKKKLSDKEEEQYQTGKKWWELLSEKAKIVGSEKVGNRECYVVEIKKEKGLPYTKVWLDKGSIVVTKGESKGPKGETVLSVFSDFRKIKGNWEIPYKTEVYMNGKIMSTILVKSLEINKGLSDSLFNPNEG